MPVNWFRDDLRPGAFQVWKEDEEKVGFTTIFFSSGVSDGCVESALKEPGACFSCAVSFSVIIEEIRGPPHLILA